MVHEISLRFFNIISKNFVKESSDNFVQKNKKNRENEWRYCFLNDL